MTNHQVVAHAVARVDDVQAKELTSRDRVAAGGARLVKLREQPYSTAASREIDNTPVVFHDGVLVETVTPLRGGKPNGGGDLFRVDYFGRGIAVAYADQLNIMAGAA